MLYVKNTEKFLIKLSLFIEFLLILICIFFLNNKKEILIGLISGYLMSIIRFRILSNTAQSLINKSDQSKKHFPYSYIVIQIVTVVFLVMSIKKSLPIFFASFIGILVMQISILINSFTELVGITKNNFE